MFTTEPSLSQRIERMIRDTRIIDPHSQIACDRPNAPDLAAIMAEPGMQTELVAVGMPTADLDATLPPDERVRRAIPYLKWMRNTATSWCFYRILRDLYDFHDPNLTESNYRAVVDRVEASGRDPGWADEVLRHRCKIETLVTSLRNKSADPSMNPPHVKFRLDVRELFHDSVTPTPYYESLVSILGERIAEPVALSRRLNDWLDATVRGDVRFASTFVPIEHRFDKPDDSVTVRVLSRAASGGVLDAKDIDILTNFVSWSVLGWHHANRKAIQIQVGPFPGLPETWTRPIEWTFCRFSGARFDLLTGSDVPAREVAAWARVFPNVYVSGDLRHYGGPPTIETNVAMRLQAVPMTKQSGFLSDAPYAEWTYGKLQVVSKAIASAFAHLIEAGYYEEEEVPPILAQILHDTPRDLYDLG